MSELRPQPSISRATEPATPSLEQSLRMPPTNDIPSTVDRLLRLYDISQAEAHRIAELFVVASKVRLSKEERAELDTLLEGIGDKEKNKAKDSV